jgi:glycosyltransferase involved in cell wall biosynthesis
MYANRLNANYISNLSQQERSGGWSGMNAAIFDELQLAFNLNYCGPISPGPDYRAKVISKCSRVLGKPGSFHAYSARRLNRIKQTVEQHSKRSVDFDFFHGITPWIMAPQYDRPYFAYTDACFATYIEHYHDPKKFLSGDVQRICRAEAQWISKAATVFFSSDYARRDAVSKYNLSGDERLVVVGLGSGMSPPSSDHFTGGLKFLFVALDFERKGGKNCVQAFQKVHRAFPRATLTVLGEKPPRWFFGIPGVEWGGFLRKSDPAELQCLQEHYKSSFALLLPTSSDMTPLVIAEAGSFGCPAIATNNFGIPEMVQHGETGLLIESPDADVLSQAMLRLCDESRMTYTMMRRRARELCLRRFRWEQVVRNIVETIEKSFVTLS